jgi:hypothetical protein
MHKSAAFVDAAHETSNIVNKDVLEADSFYSFVTFEKSGSFDVVNCECIVTKCANYKSFCAVYLQTF